VISNFPFEGCRPSLPVDGNAAALLGRECRALFVAFSRTTIIKPAIGAKFPSSSFLQQGNPCGQSTDQFSSRTTIKVLAAVAGH